jgi:fatty acid desaturase
MAGFWLGIVTSLYRDSHLRHHQHPTTLNDPDWVLQADLIDWHWPKTPKDALIVLLVDLTGVNFVKMFIVFFWQWAPWGSRAEVANGRAVWSRTRNWRQLGRVEQATFVMFVAVLAGLAWEFAAIRVFLVLWVAAMSTVLMLLLRIRGIAEHHGVRNRGDFDNTRSVLAPWYERLIIAPCNVSYHLEHHLFPSVPFYNLPRLHRLLIKDDGFRTRSERATSYLNVHNGVLKELTSPSCGVSRSNPRDVLHMRHSGQVVTSTVQEPV